jgi:hypothetical protein
MKENHLASAMTVQKTDNLWFISISRETNLQLPAPPQGIIALNPVMR